MFLRGLSTSSVWRCTGVCREGHLATLQSADHLIPASESDADPPGARTVVVYDLPTWTVSLCLAVDSARMGLSGVPLRWSDSLELCQMNLEMQSADSFDSLSGSWKQFSSAGTQCDYSVLEVFYLTRCTLKVTLYLRLIYFTYLFLLCRPDHLSIVGQYHSMCGSTKLLYKRCVLNRKKAIFDPP